MVIGGDVARRLWSGAGGLVGTVVAEQCLKDADAAGQGHDGLVVLLAFGSFAVAEAP